MTWLMKGLRLLHDLRCKLHCSCSKDDLTYEGIETLIRHRIHAQKYCSKDDLTYEGIEGQWWMWNDEWWKGGWRGFCAYRSIVEAIGKNVVLWVPFIHLSSFIIHHLERPDLWRDWDLVLYFHGSSWQSFERWPDLWRDWDPFGGIVIHSRAIYSKDDLTYEGIETLIRLGIWLSSLAFERWPDLWRDRRAMMNAEWWMMKGRLAWLLCI